MFKRIKRLFGLENEDPWQPKRPLSPTADPMAVINLKIGQKVRIDGGDLHHVAGRVDYERDGNLWHNYRLIDPRGEERWLSVEFWDEGMQVFLYASTTLFQLPDAPLAEQWFATNPDREVLYNLVEAGEAEVAEIEEDEAYVEDEGIEPISIVVGDRVTFWQYQRADYDREYISIEIWGDEKLPAKGLHLDVNTIEVIR